MRKNRAKIISIVFIVLCIILINVNVYAHSGRTDSSGGHRDNQNKSGLGSYHYHCGGYPPHLHNNGVCPYSSSSSANKSSTTSSSISSVEEKSKKQLSTTNNLDDTNSTNNSEYSNSLEGFFTLGLIGGAGYIGYKKRKNKGAN